MNAINKSDNLAYHAARLLLLIALCGKPRRSPSHTLPGIEGRTLLAKLDFFLRYPAYLRKAATILRREKKFSDTDFGLEPDYEVHSVESAMVRYFYGPWDHIYYLAIAYLVGKELIVIERKRGTEIFRLTSKGEGTATLLAQDPAYEDIAQRAETAYHLFNQFSGNRLKDFIYANFPEVVNRKIGETIFIGI